MIELTSDECRVLGVLVEKATTTPEQYPLSLNAVVNGANQKNNRDPVLTMDENRAFDALEGLRGKGLVVRVETAGARVNKYRHNAGDALRCRGGELAVLAELLLRGPQTLGELRGRASRMHPMESLDVTRAMLEALMTRDEPLVRQLPPNPGSRAERYVQLLCPDLHPTEVAAAGGSTSDEAAPTLAPAAGGLSQRVEKLEAEVSILRESLRKLATAVGEPDPFGDGHSAPPSPAAGHGESEAEDVA
jgi:uncharacterized protein